MGQQVHAVRVQLLTELDQASDTHADFMVNETQDKNPDSATYGIYSD